MPGTTPYIGNATRIWEINVHWSLYSQCGIWDPKGRGVDIWECIRARKSPLSFVCSPSCLVLSFQQSHLFPQPPNGLYWRYIARR
ncbi:uncharacterized protein EDB91DRAFT_1204316 [Suillus paluster]|uniref:uncharacterized protein n=1 Tax=Suillus paluster TaxID=48578 RepID=UPI001B867C96